MPLEIQEITIGMHVTENPAQRMSSGSQNQGAAAAEPGDRDALVKECVRQVLQALKETKDR
jgi:hypothetical protein